MTLHEQIFSALSAAGDRVVLSDAEGDLSGSALLAEVHSWQVALKSCGCRCVGVALDNGRRWVALDLALLASGCVSVPIPSFFTKAQIQHVMGAAGIDTVISDAALPGLSNASIQRAQGSVWHSLEPSAAAMLPMGTAKVTFTSGSTGQPKGVCLSAALMAQTANALCDALAGEGIKRHLSVLPFSLLLENVAGIYANLLNGSVILCPPMAAVGMSGSSGLDVGRFLAAFAAHKPHSAVLVPQLLLALTAAAEFGVQPPSSLRFLAVGGGKVATSLLQRAWDQGLPAYEGYGLSECGSVVALNRPAAHHAGSVGQPLPHVNVRIEAGEIVVEGASALGYLGGIAGVLGERIATGDLGAMDADGFLRVNGRAKNCFITSFGRNVQPEWVESELLADASVAQAVVFGEALPTNVALLVPRGDDADLDEAVASANERLPDYARVGRWRVVSAARMQRCLTPNGRPKRDLVAQEFQHDIQRLTEAVLTTEGAQHAVV